MKVLTEKQHVSELPEQHVQWWSLGRLAAAAAEVHSVTEEELLPGDIQLDRNRLVQ